jgi:membrane-associated protein
MIDVKEILLGLAPYTQYVSFGLLLLAGFNIPVSEDIVFIISASIAATTVPQNMYYIFAGCFMGAYLGDMIAYLVGRYGINKLLNSETLARLGIINREKIEVKIGIMKDYFSRYGGKTLFFGRFVPFGARNMIFMTCGLIRMKMPLFMLIDLCALTCTSLILFSLGFSFGNNYEAIFPYITKYKFIIAGFAVLFITALVIRNKLKKHKSGRQTQQ